MPDKGTQFLVDARRRKKAALLNIKEYRRLIERLGELEDTLDLDEAIRTVRTFRNYQEVRQERIQQAHLPGGFLGLNSQI